MNTATSTARPRDKTLNELYAALPAEAIAELKLLERRVTVPRGARLIEHGIMPGKVIIVISGEVNISIPCDGTSISLGSAGPGKVFGLRCAVVGEAPEINVTCLEDCEVLVLAWQLFMAVLGRHPNTCLAVARVLSSDLKIADRMLRDMSRRRPARKPSQERATPVTSITDGCNTGAYSLQ